MKVLLTTAYPTRWTYLPRFKELASKDRFGVHSLTDIPEEADLILFVDARHEHADWRLRALRSHPLVRNYRERAFIYNEMDQPWCALPGVYVSMPRGAFNPQRQRACSYVHHVNPYVDALSAVDGQPDLLFSFAGRRCHPVREQILKLRHPRAIIQDTSATSFFGTSGQEIEAKKRDYAELLARTKFVLCPRGSGPASFRLFETLAVGRVPVILGDEWVEPAGPDWPACSVRVPEAEAQSLPALLERLEDRYPEMARAAVETYREWFAPDVLFHRLVENCRAIIAERVVSEGVWCRLPDPRLLRLHARGAKGRVLELARRKQASKT